MGARDEARRRGLARFARGLSRGKKRPVEIEIGEAQMEPTVEVGEAEMEPTIEIGEAVLEKADDEDDERSGRPVGTGPHKRR